MFYIMQLGQYRRQYPDECERTWTHKRAFAWVFETKEAAQKELNSLIKNNPEYYDRWGGEVKFKKEKAV